MAAEVTEKPLEPIVFSDPWIDYEELYDELFSRAEQSIGAQLHPVDSDEAVTSDAV